MIRALRAQKHVIHAIRTTAQDHAQFGAVIAVLLFATYLLAPIPEAAMWLGFGIAGYSAIANDSIQTLGTFLSSNRKLPWWLLWIFVGGVLAVTYSIGWFSDGGDIAFDRLAEIPQPTSFTFLTLSAPIILLILTRLRMPVSTTFLLLSVFSSSMVIQKMLVKTFFGYVVAFAAALVVWTFLSWLYHRHEFPSKHYSETGRRHGSSLRTLVVRAWDCSFHCSSYCS